MQRTYITTNHVHLHVVQDGPEDGPLVLLLHGFPEFHHGWRRQIPALADAGFRVWAPDQRGYNLSDKPDRLDDYVLDELAADVIGLIDAAGRDDAYLVGHDWGGAVAWWVAANYPQRIKRLAILNAPHGAVLQKQLRTNRSQLRKSWYFFLFQIPGVPEALIRARNWRRATAALRATSRTGTFTEADFVQYRRAWSQPGAFTGMLNWYRAAIQKPSKPPKTPRITMPTLLIWGTEDRFLGHELAQPSIDLCDDGR